MLYLKYYVDGLGRLGAGQSGGGQYRVVLEYLVDSMDLDQAWCSRNLDPASPAWQIVLDFAQLKQARLGKHPKYHGNITALIQNKSQLEAALRIPGRDLPIGESNFCPSWFPKIGGSSYVLYEISGSYRTQSPSPISHSQVPVMTVSPHVSYSNILETFLSRVGMFLTTQ